MYFICQPILVDLPTIFFIINVLLEYIYWHPSVFNRKWFAQIFPEIRLEILSLLKQYSGFEAKTFVSDEFRREATLIIVTPHKLRNMFSPTQHSYENYPLT